MSSSKSSEHRRLWRFLSSGVVNTLVGFAVIFFLMLLGVNPSVANVAGYAVGLSLSFLLSRHYVFDREDAAHRQAGRFLLAFTVSFGANFLTLQGLLSHLQVPPVVAQIVAAVVYTASMYGLSRFFVFRSAGSGP